MLVPAVSAGNAFLFFLPGSTVENLLPLCFWLPSHAGIGIAGFLPFSVMLRFFFRLLLREWFFDSGAAGHQGASRFMDEVVGRVYFFAAVLTEDFGGTASAVLHVSCSCKK